MSADILEKIRKADKLPSLPAVAFEVLELTKSEDVSLERLAEVIQRDPALTVTILKMVNSAFYGLSRKVTSLKQATLILGLRTVKVMVLSFSLVKALQGKDKFDYPSYWRRSLTMAVGARLLAQALRPVIAEEAFISGLLSDLGMIAAYRCAPQMYQPVLEAWEKQPRPLIEIERELLGITHPAMGAELMKTWSLPESLCVAVGAHHGEGLEELDGLALELAEIVYAASDIAALFCRDIPFSELDRVKKQCKKRIGVNDAVLEGTLQAMDKHVKDAATILSLQVGETIDYAQMQIDAAMQLAQLSMQAEMDRAVATRREEEARQEVGAAKSRMTTMESQITTLEGRARKADSLEHSVKVASQRQRRMMPSTAPPVKGAQIGILYLPAEGISGDFYDFVTLADGRIGFLVADVSGHGIEAGIVMAMAKKSLTEQLQKHGDPVVAIGHANDDLCRTMEADCFVTACVAVYDPPSRSLSIASAGHDPPLIYRQSQDAFVELESAGLPLGVMEGTEFEMSDPIVLRLGDVFVFMTDGVFECMNAQDELFGKNRLREIVGKHALKKASDVIAAVQDAVLAWNGDRPLRDDVTLVVVKIEKS